jgi:ABC-type branched-subunit amino acid transport system substrate-binding protein
MLGVRREYHGVRMAVAGNFPDVSFPDLIQFYCLSKRTVAIRVTCPDLPEASGEFYVADGELLDAKLGDRVGVDAFYRALQIHRGSFEIQVDVRPPSRSIHLPLNEVLLQGMTRMDEAGKSGPRLTHRDVLDQVEEAFADSPTQPPVVTGPLPQPEEEAEEEDPAQLATEARRRKVVGLVVVGASLMLGILAILGIGMFRASAPSTALEMSRSTATEAVTMPAAPAPNAPGQLTQGVTDTSVLFGMAAPFTGPAKELGRQTRVGIELAFAEANAGGGVHGRQLQLQPEDDAFEPGRVAPAMRALWETKKVFAFLGNVGPAAGTASAFAVDRRALLVGAFSGAAALRREPPDRYVFNYRASDAEETAAVFKYLLSARALRPEQIAVLTEDDASGDAGFDGVARVLRQLHRDPRSTLRVTYPRNTLEVDGAVARIRNHAHPIRAVVMVVPYRPAARFIERMRRISSGMVFTNVSSVGANALAEELIQSSPDAAEGVIVTQVVPPLDSELPAVAAYRAALARYLPDERPDSVSLESWLATRVLLAGLTRAGPPLDTEKLVDALESIRGLDLGTGSKVSFGPSEHQASHTVWGTMLDGHGQYRKLPLE